MCGAGVDRVGSADLLRSSLRRAFASRRTEATGANKSSSRSHAVVQVTVEQSEATAHVTGNVRIGYTFNGNAASLEFPLCADFTDAAAMTTCLVAGIDASAPFRNGMR